MFVGGEFYDDAAWVTTTPAPPVADALFLNGGRACLSVIATYLYKNKCKSFLLPSYLCPSILDVLDQNSINYTFYQINEDFSINLDDLLTKTADHQVIYFINYFGFQHSTDNLSVLRQLQTNGKILIEDNAQAGFPSRRLGDFSFNSVRKFSALDGSYLTTRIMPFFFNRFEDRPNHRLPLIREYRRQLRSYLFEARGNREDLDRLFYRAEYYYEHDNVILGDKEEQIKIESQDWLAIKEVRRNNYTYLLDLIIDLPGITPVYPKLQPEIMPLGLPVYISGFPRDQLITLLAEESISLTIHWETLLADPRTQSDAGVIEMAKHILTLPVDQYTSMSQLNFLVKHLKNILTEK
jgi:hypothetical protein